MVDKRLAGAVAILLVLIVSAAGFLLVDEEVNCENQYDQALNGKINSEDIPEKCEPLPEEVEEKLLLQALSDSDREG